MTFVKRFFRTQNITLARVPVGLGNIMLPIAHLRGGNPGPTLVITAGMDGDEYAPIAAAYQLIEEFQTKRFAGALIIIPIVNTPGFEKEMSANPMDGKFPKRIYPGNRSGSPTERLVYWLHTNVIHQAHVWLDMHAGALSERLTPFVHAWETGNAAVDAKTREILMHIKGGICVYERTHGAGKAQILAAHGCGYVLTESGDFGHVHTPSINRHLLWAHTVMSCVGNLKKGYAKENDKTVYRAIDTYRVGKEGVWYPAVFSSTVKRGRLMGVVRGFDYGVKEKILVRESGTMLWIKEGMRVNAGDTVLGVARQEMILR